MLEIGIDVSGNNQSGNYKYMGIVIGTQECINSQMRRLGTDRLHMRDIVNKKHKDEILNQLNFDVKDVIAFCLLIEQKKIMDEVLKIKRGKKDRVSSSKVKKQFNKQVWNHVKNEITNFINEHGYELNNVGFQCDQDCYNFLRDNGLKCNSVGKAHVLSDVVAWFNNNS